jgi:hypothetical protein
MEAERPTVIAHQSLHKFAVIDFARESWMISVMLRCLPNVRWISDRTTQLPVLTG